MNFCIIFNFQLSFRALFSMGAYLYFSLYWNRLQIWQPHLENWWNKFIIFGFLFCMVSIFWLRVRAILWTAKVSNWKFNLKTIYTWRLNQRQTGALANSPFQEIIPTSKSVPDPLSSMMLQWCLIQYLNLKLNLQISGGYW